MVLTCKVIEAFYWQSLSLAAAAAAAAADIAAKMANVSAWSGEPSRMVCQDETA